MLRRALKLLHEYKKEGARADSSLDSSSFVGIYKFLPDDTAMEKTQNVVKHLTYLHFMLHVSSIVSFFEFTAFPQKPKRSPSLSLAVL